MVLGKTLKKLLEQRDITFRKLSEDTGVGLSTIKDWANGASPRDLDGLRTVSKYLGVSLEFLIWGAEDNHQPRSLEEVLTKQVFDGWLKVSVSRVIPAELDWMDDLNPSFRANPLQKSGDPRV